MMSCGCYLLVDLFLIALFSFDHNAPVVKDHRQIDFYSRDNYVKLNDHGLRLWLNKMILLTLWKCRLLHFTLFSVWLIPLSLNSCCWFWWCPLCVCCCCCCFLCVRFLLFVVVVVVFVLFLFFVFLLFLKEGVLRNGELCLDLKILLSVTG